MADLDDELSRLVSLQRQALRALAGGLHHTESSLENIAAGHLVFGAALGAPECCRRAYTRRKRRLQAGVAGLSEAVSGRRDSTAISPEEAAMLEDYRCGNWERVRAVLAGERPLERPLPDSFYSRFASAVYPCSAECSAAIDRGRDVEAQLDGGASIRRYRASLIGNVLQDMTAAAERFDAQGIVTTFDDGPDPAAFFEDHGHDVLRHVPENPHARLRYVERRAG